MIEYLKNIIPRIKKYSKELDKVENFVDKNWIYIDSSELRHEYLFLRDKRIIMTADTITREGTWDLLPTGELLIKRTNSDLIKLSNLFVEDALLILKYSASNDTPFVLINQKIIPDLNVELYLNRFEQHQKEIETSSLKKYSVLENGELKGPEIYLGKQIETVDGIVLNGVYKTANINLCKYVVIENNFIRNIYFHNKYFYQGKVFILEQNQNNDPKRGEKILKDKSTSLPINKYFIAKDKDDNRFWLKIDSKFNVIGSYDYLLIIILTILIFGLSGYFIYDNILNR